MRPDDFWLHQAIDAAQSALYTTDPNPRVGCVLVRDGVHLATGWHERAGEAHAEVAAIQSARANGHHVGGATAYVTLEPCCHHGRTPPCADLLIAAGIARVVVASRDPNPLVAGRGLARLADAGIEIGETTNRAILTRAAELNPGFWKRMRCRQPWLRLKIAASLDGKIALANGHSHWLSHSAARTDGHRYRARASAILSTAATVIADDAQLSVRGLDTPLIPPERWIIDNRLRLATTDKAKRLFRVNAPDQAGRIVVISTTHDSEARQRLKALGAELLVLPGRDGRVDLTAILNEMGKQAFNEIHVEAGGRLASALLTAELVDEIVYYLAPKLLGNEALDFFSPQSPLTELTSAAHFDLDSVTSLVAEGETPSVNLRLLLRPCNRPSASDWMLGQVSV